MFTFLKVYSKKDIVHLNIPTGVPLIYTLDANMKPIPHVDAIAPIKGQYLGDLEKVKAQINAIGAQRMSIPKQPPKEFFLDNTH